MAKEEEVKFFYEEETDTMYVTRYPHKTTGHVLELNPNMRLLVDESVKKVVGIIIFNYYEFIPKFFEHKKSTNRKCSECSTQRECFADNIKSLLQSPHSLRRVEEQRVVSNIAKEIKGMPEEEFACAA